ncbi:hypothetical protein [Candidatus Venteria ishoeyi]|uniref:hypothetical protein n=1 Tax=Candidatus Venteria ishoeyi TaxID=1899563 RepID=UPI0011AFE6E2|nr:hypothetical protein [Candidatus Venteria ishoeyi]
MLFEDFLSTWSTNYKKVPAILKYISSYPILKSKFKAFNPPSEKVFDEFQLEWIALLAQLTNPIDTEFYKPFWVPIQSDKYDFFIDISSDKFLIFEVDYMFFEPYRWQKKYLFDDISDFLNSVDDLSINIDEIIKLKKDEYWKDVNAFFQNRLILGLECKIEFSPLDKYSIVEEDASSSYKLSGKSLMFYGVNSVIVGLLPREIEITLIQLDVDDNKYKDYISKVENIHGLTFLLQQVGVLRVDFYYFEFNQYPDCYAKYQNDTLTIEHTDVELLKELIRQYTIL